jgi:prephenate dehydrogenase
MNPFVEENCLLVDFVSVKQNAVKALQKIDRKIEIASVHPMHGPRVKSVEGFPVVFIIIKKIKTFKNRLASSIERL